MRLHTAALQQPLGKLEPQEISNICWAIGKQFLTDEKDTVWKLCNTALAMGLSQFPGQGISNISWTLARLSLQHHDFLEVSGAAGTMAGIGNYGRQWQCHDCAAAWRQEGPRGSYKGPPT